MKYLITEDQRQLVKEVSDQIGQSELARRADTGPWQINWIIHGRAKQLTMIVCDVLDACEDYLKEEKKEANNEGD